MVSTRDGVGHHRCLPPLVLTKQPSQWPNRAHNSDCFARTRRFPCEVSTGAYLRRVAVDWRRTAILNLVADATHNFTDGLAIGVAFGRGEHEVATTLGKMWICAAAVQT